MKDILRSRLDEDLDKNALELLSSLHDDRKIIFEDIIGTLAHNYMLFKQDIISLEDFTKIANALFNILKDFKQGKFELDLKYEDIHPLIESKVIDMIGIESGGRIHTGRSRNDQVALDIRLKLRTYLLQVRKDAIFFLKNLIEQAEKYKTSSFPLYTHLQQAQIGTFGHLICSYAFELIRHLDRMKECFSRTNLSPLGACAIGGTSIPINRAITADQLGFNGIILNSVDAISSRDVLIEHASIIASLSSFLSRISEDLILYSSNEYDYIEIGDKFCSVSSVLPQKKNPDTLELIRANGAISMGNLLSQLSLTKGIATGYHRDFQECKPLLWDSYEKLIIILPLFSGIIKSIKLNKEIVNQVWKSSNLMALDLAEYLVLNKNFTFRETHEFIARMVQFLAERNTSIPNSWDDNEIRNIKEIAKEVLGDEDVIDKEFLIFKDRKDYFNLKSSEGGPSEEETNKMIQILKGMKKKHDIELKNDRNFIDNKINSFINIVEQLIKN